MTSRRMKSTVAFVVAISSVGILDVAHATYYGRDAFFSGNGLPDAAIAALVYYEDSNVSNLGYSNITLSARTEFDNVTDAVINFRRAASSEINSAKLRFFAVTGGTKDYYWFGKTFNYDINGYELSESAAVTAAWSKVDLKLNDEKMNLFGFTQNQRTRIAVHELGHVLSMVHQPSGYSHQSSVMQENQVEYWHLSPVDIANLQYMY
ncbi:hypothetical protein [Tumebacillus lipolyticus]|uniref:Peptidase metallopeptidase domain-containing protein n=1 Tax=Tumebacillus lipolyticus TaxID=1280370 RepID=A0ABW4ZYH5_9BACL